jgi:hypothetical protein
MQISENTLTVLKNFSTINTGLFFKQGNTLRTVSPSKTVLAEATIDETIPADFGVYELNQLLAILSLHKTSAEVTVQGNNLVIQGNGGRSKITYRCCDATMIKTPPDKNITLPSEEVSFALSEDDFNWIIRSSSVLGSPNLSVFSRDGKLYIGTLDGADDAAHTDSLEIGPHTGTDVEFLFKTENWKMVPGNYLVTISSKGIASFQNQARKIRYWVATEARKK